MKKCPQNEELHNVTDTAYSGGVLSLSSVGQCLLPSFCVERGCYVAIVTAGDASGYKSKERKQLIDQFQACGGNLASTEWSGPSERTEARANCSGVAISSPLVAGCQDKTKQYAVASILQWFKDAADVTISPQNVWHYDDRADNVAAFTGSGFNARQVSCATRDYGGSVGLCGATNDELRDDQGIITCHAAGHHHHHHGLFGTSHT